MTRSVFLLVPALLACGCDPGGGPALPSYEGWLRGDLHVHTDHSDGWNDVATIIGVVEYLESETFVAAHPEFEGNGIDFLAITDHRTVAVQDDPAWVSDRLILVGGEEFGGPGHANRFGITEIVDHDPDGDGVTLEDLQSAVEETHAQGGVFSPNHPFTPGIPWPWDIRDHDAIEVWNNGWALGSPEFKDEDLQDWESSRGPAGPLFVRAVQGQGRTSSMQALTWYEAQLSRGVHVALLGGSDHHAVLLPGFPTTWIRTDAKDEDGLVQGIRDRRTSVSRTPVSTRVLMEVQLDGGIWQLGDDIPVPATGAEVTVAIRVGRGLGGLLRLVAGEAVQTDEDLRDAPLGSVVYEERVEGDDFTTETTLEVRPGTWFYPVVLDELVRPDLTGEQAELVREMAVSARDADMEDFTALGLLFVELVDLDVLLDASLCDPADWEPENLQCIPADDFGMASMYVPDMLDRALNVIVEEDGAITEWSMGAVGSAVLFVQE